MRIKTEVLIHTYMWRDVRIPSLECVRCNLAGRIMSSPASHRLGMVRSCLSHDKETELVENDKAERVGAFLPDESAWICNGLIFNTANNFSSVESEYLNGLVIERNLKSFCNYSQHWPDDLEIGWVLVISHPP